MASQPNHLMSYLFLSNFTTSTGKVKLLKVDFDANTFDNHCTKFQACFLIMVARVSTFEDWINRAISKQS